jgi:hypothetical protein
MYVYGQNEGKFISASGKLPVRAAYNRYYFFGKSKVKTSRQICFVFVM